MRIKNKKTGGLANLIVNKDHFEVRTDDAGYAEYSSLAKLNEEWEDYEEPEVIYYLSWDGVVLHSADKTGWKDAKQIGNYFETEEEAEKAVEKLKAWKRLRDIGFVFKGINEENGSIKTGLTKNVRICESVKFYEDIELLFGGNQ